MATTIAKLAIQVQANTKGVQKGLRRAGKNVDTFSSKVASASAALGRFGKVAGAALGVGLGLATREAGGFEQAMARVRAITNATIGDFKRLEKQALDLGRTTEFTAGQAAKAQGAFALAGFSTDEILSALPSTLKLASAAQIGIAESAEIAAGIMGGMGIEAKDLGASMEILARGATSALTTIEEMGEAFKFVGPVGRLAGKDLAEMTATLQVFADANIRGSEAGTALRKILIRLQAPPADARDALKALNVEVFDQAGEMKNLATIVDELNASMSSLSKPQRAAKISAIAGIKAFTALGAALLAGGKEIRDNEAALRAHGNTLDRMAKVQLDTLFGSFKRLTSALSGLGIGIGKITNRFLRPLIEGMAKAINVITDFFIKNEDVIAALITQVAEMVKEFFRVKEILGVVGSFFDKLGVTGETALERLSSGLAIVSTVLNNLELTIKIVKTLFALSFEEMIGKTMKFGTVARNVWTEFKTVSIAAIEAVGKVLIAQNKFLFELALENLLLYSKVALKVRELTTLKITPGQFAKDLKGIFTFSDVVKDLDKDIKDIGEKFADVLGKSIAKGVLAGTEQTRQIEKDLKKKLGDIGQEFLDALAGEKDRLALKLKVDRSEVEKATDAIKKLLGLSKRQVNVLRFGSAEAITSERGLGKFARTDSESAVAGAANVAGGVKVQESSEQVAKNTMNLIKLDETRNTTLDDIRDAVEAQEEVVSFI